MSADSGEAVPLERGDGDPMLLVGDGTHVDDLHRIISRLEAAGYDVGLEYAGEHQRAYVIDHDGFGGEARGE